MSGRGIGFIASRYLKSRRREKGMAAPILAIIGLAAGVLTLNAVLSVMNGFQLTFIESILEVSSSHLRWETPQSPSPELRKKLLAVEGVRSVEPYYEGQTLIQGPLGGQRGALLRGVDPQAILEDEGFRSKLSLVEGRFVQSDGEILLGSELARSLGVRTGDSVLLMALTGDSFSLLEPQQKKLSIVGIFQTDYFEIDAGWALVTLSTAQGHFATAKDFHYGIKLWNENADRDILPKLARAVGAPEKEFVSWRDFNASFFGALKTEKTAMMVLIGLIFLVVGVNIFYSQRRGVQEHREDIALWQAVGVPVQKIRLFFALEGAGVGILGACLGTVLGITVSCNIPFILGAAEGTLNFFLGLFRQQGLVLLSSQAFYLPRIPARLLPQEVVFIAAVAVVTASGAAWIASRQVSKIPVAEVLKNE